MKQFKVLALLALLVMKPAAAATPEFVFEGNRIGDPMEEVLERTKMTWNNCVNEGRGRSYCTKLTYGTGTRYVTFFEFLDGRFAGTSTSFDSARTGEVRTMVESQYGPPNRTEQSIVNVAGDGSSPVNGPELKVTYYWVRGKEVVSLTNRMPAKWNADAGGLLFEYLPFLREEATRAKQTEVTP